MKDKDDKVGSKRDKVKEIEEIKDNDGESEKNSTEVSMEYIASDYSGCDLTIQKRCF